MLPLDMPCQQGAQQGGSVPDPQRRQPNGRDLEEIHYRLLKRLEQQPDVSQRELAKELGVSLGKVNYCLKDLVDKGWVKIGNFRRNPNKLAYTYILTPQGVAGKAHVTADFLRRKLVEYETLTRQIAELQQELKSTPADQPD